MIPSASAGGRAVLVVVIAYALAMTCAMRCLSLVYALGELVVHEALRIAILVVFTALGAWLVLRTKTIEGRPTWHFELSLARATFAGVATGFLGGAAAMAVGAIPEPTGTSTDTLLKASVFLFLGGLLGMVVGPLAGLGFGGFTRTAFERISAVSADGFEGALVASATLLAIVGAASSLLHACSGTTDVVGIAALVASVAGFAFAAVLDRRRAAWLERVASGATHEWTIAPNDSPTAVPRFVHGDVDDAVLLRTDPREPTFRESPHAAVVVASLAKGAVDTRAHLRRRGMRYAISAPVVGVFVIASLVVAADRRHAPPSWNDDPKPVARMTAMTHIAATGGVMCARRSRDGRLVCWGSSAGLYLGARWTATRTPEPFSKLGRIVTFALGDGRACAVPEGGERRAACWTTKDPSPRPAGPPGIVELALMGSATIALTSDGDVWRWGDDLALGGRDLAPTKIPGLSAIAHIDASASHAVALGKDGSVSCWGVGTGECGPDAKRDVVSRIEGGPFDRVVPFSGATFLRGKDHRWRKIGMSLPEYFLVHDENAIDMRASGSDACFIHPGGRLMCTRANDAPQWTTFDWGVLEVAGNREDGFCALTASEIWCWKGYPGRGFFA